MATQSRGLDTDGRTEEIVTRTVGARDTSARSEQVVAARAVTSAQVRTTVVAESNKKELSEEETTVLLSTLKSRFELVRNRKLHPNLQWNDVARALEKNQAALWSLQQMEQTGGEPDVLELDDNATEFVFVDCSKESPEGRRNVVYDEEAQRVFKRQSQGATCQGNAVGIAGEWGVDLMDEEIWRTLHSKSRIANRITHDWLKTSAERRRTGLASSGYRHEDLVNVATVSAHRPHDYKGFRCVLRVPKVAA